ncbi:Carboxypeptidase S1-like B [Pseudocercospora fuligena]|uniref:Carboxypeptidase n=1 Tax=Pseudocercospora fuligena TaxID=685502 RepID=A0A8H6VJC9_9PEZI|nr:Carboxypeptidase S1-like B [Pseudocercospora fuligena]
MQATILLIAVVACAPAVLAQFVTAPQDLTAVQGNGYQVRYKEVESGICETVSGVRSYSGYIDVEEHQHLFFWFFEARNQDPLTAPLTLWLNGGPGDPSMVGLFSENGPCWIDYNGTLQVNDNSWTNVSNVLYLDQPTDTGFSYSIPVNGYIDADTGYLVELPNATCPGYATADSCGTYASSNVSYTVNNTLAAAPYVWKALQGFTGAFPHHAQNGVYLSTESYGGHFGPVFADFILDQNERKEGAHIDLRGLSVGNGWFDPIIQFEAYYNYTVNPGNSFDFHPFNATTQAQMENALYGEGNCLDQLYACNYGPGTDGICSAADNFCYDEVEYIFDTVTGRDEYDIRELTPDPFPYTSWVAYLNKPEIQKAIGAYTNFTYSVTNLGAGTVATAFGTTGDDSRGFDIIDRTRRLINDGVYVVHYAGDADYNCNWIGGEEVARQIDASGFTAAGYQYLTTSTFVANGSQSAFTEQVHGVVKQASNYAFARIYDSGHQVPFYKPKAALALFQRLVKGTDLATGKERIDQKSEYVSVGPQKSEHRNDPSTIQEDVVDASCLWDPETNMPVC